MKVDTRANDRKVGGIESPAPEGSQQLPPERKHKAPAKLDRVLRGIQRIKVLLSEYPEHEQGKILRYLSEEVQFAQLRSAMVPLPKPAEDKTP